jgi:hypothetical protein
MRTPVWLYLLIFPFLTACPVGEVSGNDFPGSIEGIEIDLYEGGGMLPISTYIYICQDSAYWKYDQYKSKVLIRWVPEKKDLDQLYQTFIENDFDKIKFNDQGEVYDRGGTTINIKIKEEIFKLDNSGSSFIDKDDKANFSSINDAIKNYANKQIEKKMIEVPLVPTEAIINCNYKVQLALNDVIIYQVEDGKAPKTIDVKAYPGPNKFDFSLFYKDSTNNYGGLVRYKSDMIIEEIDSNTKGIILDLANEFIDIQIEN